MGISMAGTLPGHINNGWLTSSYYIYEFIIIAYVLFSSLAG